MDDKCISTTPRDKTCLKTTVVDKKSISLYVKKFPF
jgi:hypothetical protein